METQTLTPNPTEAANPTHQGVYNYQPERANHDEHIDGLTRQVEEDLADRRANLDLTVEVGHQDDVEKAATEAFRAVHELKKLKDTVAELNGSDSSSDQEELPVFYVKLASGETRRVVVQEKTDLSLPSLTEDKSGDQIAHGWGENAMNSGDVDLDGSMSDTGNSRYATLLNKVTDGQIQTMKELRALMGRNRPEEDRVVGEALIKFLEESSNTDEIFNQRSLNLLSTVRDGSAWRTEPLVQVGLDPSNFDYNGKGVVPKPEADIQRDSERLLKVEASLGGEVIDWGNEDAVAQIVDLYDQITAQATEDRVKLQPAIDKLLERWNTTEYSRLREEHDAAVAEVRERTEESRLIEQSLRGKPSTKESDQAWLASKHQTHEAQFRLQSIKKTVQQWVSIGAKIPKP